MNRLTPELKRLIRLARQAPAPPAEVQPPFGFTQCIIRSWRDERAIDPMAIWQRAVWKSAWAASAVLLLGLVFLTVQRLRANSPYDVSPAYEVVSMELVP